MSVAILTMSIMGLLFGMGLAFASRIFKVETNPMIERILGILPGGNCGACGKAGCASFAEAVVTGEGREMICPVGGKEVQDKIREMLGLEKKDFVKKVARVRCGGGNRAKDKFIYQGVETCVAANLIMQGQKLCSYGCLGFGDCINVCPFDAIHMDENNIPKIDITKCTGCGICVSACPRSIISLEPADERYYVKCLSHDKADFVKKACSVGCIGCKICERLSKGSFIVENNLSRLDYTKVVDSTPLKLCAEKCPTNCIVEI